MDKLELLKAYEEVEATGNRIGFLKKELIPLADELVKEGLLKEDQKGLYSKT